MSAEIKYKGETVETLCGGEYVTLHTKGKALEDDIRVELTEEGGVVPVVEGTAIPVGEVIDRIYFNTNLTIAKTNAILSQLTYVQTPLFEYPLYVPFLYDDGDELFTVLIIKADNQYIIWLNRSGDISTAQPVGVFDSRGWRTYFSGTDFDIEGEMSSVYAQQKYSLSEWNGIPIGAENEKIKKVISITPFLAQVEDDPVPTEVKTEAEMTALLETADVGSVYKYTGESGTYENGALYVVEESE